jgi:hypothetical protein
MKKGLLVLLALTTVFAFSCKEKPQPGPEPPEEEVLTVPTKTYSVDKNEGTLDIDLQANYKFTATVSDDAKEWLYVASTRAVESHVVTVGYRTNPLPKERRGIVTIKSTTLTETVEIIQAPGDATITVNAEDRTVNPRGMTIVIPVTSNDEVVVTPDARWMRVKEVTSEGYVIEIDINDTGAPREGTITFSSKSDPNVKATVTITQKPANVDPHTLKLLAVANSAVVDAMQDLPSVLAELGYTNLKLGYFLVDDNLDAQAEAFSAENATLKYYYTNAEGTWNNVDTLVTDVLAPDDWDYVILGQTIADGGNDATFDAGITKIVETVRKSCEYVPFAWHMTWAYQASSTNAGFKAYDNDQNAMYDAIVTAVKNKIEGKADFEKIIPVGTAVQNLRTSFFEDNLTSNGVNLSVNVGRLADALTWAKAITGKSIDGVSYTFNPERYKYESYYLPAIKEAVNNAIDNPFKVTESVNYLPRKTKLADAAGAKNMITAAGYNPADYVEVPITIIHNAYFASTESSTLKTGFNGTAASDANLKKFASTHIFPKAQIPIGTLIVVMEGYQYRPDAWTALGTVTASASRPGNVTAGVVEVTDAWWGSFNFRGFNIAKSGAPELTDSEQNALDGIFGIFIPKSVLGLGGLEDYGNGQWTW